MRSSFIYVLALVCLTCFTSFSTAAQTTDVSTTSNNQNLQTIKLKVSGITCSGDCRDIEKVLAETKGVQHSKHLGKPTATTSFQVTFDPAVVTEKELRKIVEDTPGCESPDDRPYKVKKAS